MVTAGKYLFIKSWFLSSKDRMIMVNRAFIAASTFLGYELGVKPPPARTAKDRRGWPMPVRQKIFRIEQMTRGATPAIAAPKSSAPRDAGPALQHHEVLA